MVRRGHPLLGRRARDRSAELSAYEWVMQPRGTPLRRTIDNLFLAANAAAARPLPQHDLALPDDDAGRRAPTRSRRCRSRRRNFASDSSGAPGALAILPTDFAIVVQPYSLIALRHRAAVAGGPDGLRHHPRAGGGAACNLTVSPSSLVRLAGLRSSKSSTASDGRASFAPLGVTTIGRFTRIGCSTIASRS